MRNVIQNSITANGPVILTQGDEIVLTLWAGSNEQAFDVTSATFSTQILGPQGVPVVFGNDQHAVIDGPDGEFTLSLAETDTANLAIGEAKDIVTQITDSSNNVAYFWAKGILTVRPPFPLS
jgi:hypothetical protein